MKHAFLVIAHNNFKNLQRIVSALDCCDTGFFIHYDRKCKEIPEITAEHSRVFVCPNRVNVHWGDVSQIKCELTLLKFALGSGTKYDYYHIISGTHLPLVGIGDFDSYFKEKPAAVFQSMECFEGEIDMKLRRWNLCTKTFKNPSAFIARTSQIIWRLTNDAQRIIGINKYNGGHFVKVCQWCSLSHSAASCLIERGASILAKYRWTFCGDEFFAASELVPTFGDRIDFRTDYLYQRFQGASPVLLHTEDLDAAKGFLWARKFEDKL